MGLSQVKSVCSHIFTVWSIEAIIIILLYYILHVHTNPDAADLITTAEMLTEV